MPKKVLYLFLCGICVMGLLNCGEGKYADAKKVTVKYLDAMEAFASAVENADSSEVLVSAVDEFAEKMDELRPEMEVIGKKYPELTDAAIPPAEMEDLAHRMNTLSQRLIAAQSKLMEYSSDLEVQQALQKLQNIK
ncbi:MAG: hypothetical protein PVI66_07910 [Candidatus Aminicenantes bacterium]